MTTNLSKIISPSTLCSLIERVESYLPGWWWSISQYENETIISYGPTDFSLLDVDRQLSITSLDSGIIRHYDFKNSLDERAIIDWFMEQLNDVNKMRQDVLNDQLISKITFPPFKGKHRKQSKDDLHKFKVQYRAFYNKFDSYQKDFAYITNIYVGSCELSVDCSIRGLYLNKEFDISFDYVGDAILAMSFQDAVESLDNKEFK